MNNLYDPMIADLTLIASRPSDTDTKRKDTAEYEAASIAYYSAIDDDPAQADIIGHIEFLALHTEFHIDTAKKHALKIMMQNNQGWVFDNIAGGAE